MTEQDAFQAQPQPALILDADEEGVVLEVICPYCRQEHRHIIIAGTWDRKKPAQAGCGQGEYWMEIKGSE